MWITDIKIKRIQSIAVTMIFLILFGIGGLWLPEYFLSRKQADLTKGQVSVTKTEISPYEQNRYNQERIAALTELLGGEALFWDVLLYENIPFQSEMFSRETLPGELQQKEATVMAEKMLNCLETDRKQSQSDPGKLYINDPILYASKTDTQLSVWGIYFTRQAEETVQTGYLVLDGISGFPLLLYVYEKQSVSGKMEMLLKQLMKICQEEFDMKWDMDDSVNAIGNILDEEKEWADRFDSPFTAELKIDGMREETRQDIKYDSRYGSSKKLWKTLSKEKLLSQNTFLQNQDTHAVYYMEDKDLYTQTQYLTVKNEYWKMNCLCIDIEKGAGYYIWLEEN